MKTLVGLIFIFLFSTAQITYAQRGLVGYWSFDKLEGDNFKDNSQNTNSGIAYNAYSSKGVKGNALSFNGIDSYAKIHQKGEVPQV
ncbi:MAG: hypothetical protein R3182_10400, partial [Draconibacterium sp.]|nr:hypothetical protein [Draconibacterium sp.]